MFIYEIKEVLDHFTLNMRHDGFYKQLMTEITVFCLLKIIMEN